MITKEDLQEFVSITKNIPDEVGYMPDGTYNTRFLGAHGEYVFLYLNPKTVLKIQKDLKNSQGKSFCGCVSAPRLRPNMKHHAFVCTLQEGHDGLCVAGYSPDGIAAIFEPTGDKTDGMMYALTQMLKRLVDDDED